MPQAATKDNKIQALNEGDTAPTFTDIPATGNQTVSLTDYRGQKIVLYFYPKDNTPGCTTEAKDFSTMKSAFNEAGAIILGVSKDSIKKHENFCTKQDLSLTLLSDENSEICENYGVWVEKNMYGRSYMGIERSTFLIDEEGMIQRIWRKVKVKGHAEDVLEAVKNA